MSKVRSLFLTAFVLLGCLASEPPVLPTVYPWNANSNYCNCAFLGFTLPSILFLRPQDPVYNGKPLSQYMQDCYGAAITFGNIKKEEGEPIQLELPTLKIHADLETYEAIRHVGSNAIPLLTEMLGKEPNPVALKLWEVAQQNKLGWIIKRRPSDHFREITFALLAFRELGSNAVAAIPSIIPLLTDCDTAPAAIVALSFIRPTQQKDVLSLTNVFQIQKTSSAGASPTAIQSQALLALSSFGTNASGVQPFLLQCLNSTNSRVQASAAVALARIGTPSELVVPVVNRQLNKSMRAGFPFSGPDSDALFLNLWALCEYGGRAVSALPVLTEFTRSNWIQLREAAQEVINKIQADGRQNVRFPNSTP